MERQSDCSFPAGSQSHPFGVRNVARQGAGDYRAGWYLLDDDAVELDDPVGWEPLTQDRAWFENEMSGEPRLLIITE